MPDNNRESTFGRDLMKFVSSRMPYQSFSILDKINEINPKFDTFRQHGSKRQDNLIARSVSSSLQTDQPNASILKNRDFFEYMYASIQPDKAKRLVDYRIMAAFAEVSDALDEICDEAINVDGEGNIVKLKLKDTELSNESKKIIEAEFKKYIGYFELERKGWEYYRNLLIDAEIYFEHIISNKEPKKGVLGVLTIPSEIIDPIYSNVQNMLVKGFLLRKPIYDAKNPGKISNIELIPLDGNQVVYINSGIWNENKSLRLPFIENARRSYRQLSLIEDSIVIYRLVRAPEKLVFNVDVGNMAAPKAEAYLKRLMGQYWAKRTFDADQNGSVQKYNPQSMLDSYWFAKRQGSEGTSVTQLPGGANLGQLDDLLYFMKKLYRALKVPVSRIAPEDVYNDGENILREELKFAKFVVRLQQRFAAAIKPGFITHLKLKGLWEELNLRDYYFDLEFNVPTNFYEMRENQKFQLKANSYTTITAGELISKTFSQKKYLGWSDQDILANREFIRKDAEIQWEIDQIKTGGPNWRENQAASLGAGAEAGGGPLPPGIGGGGGGGGVPPAFGPGPTPEGGEAEAPPEGSAPAPVEPPPAGGAPVAPGNA
jgi:hypothetical protein